MDHSMVWHRRCRPSRRMLDTFYSKEKYADPLIYAGAVGYDFWCYAQVVLARTRATDIIQQLLLGIHTLHCKGWVRWLSNSVT